MPKKNKQPVVEESSEDMDSQLMAQMEEGEMEMEEGEYEQDEGMMPPQML